MFAMPPPSGLDAAGAAGGDGNGGLLRQRGAAEQGRAGD
jgi:hypothetical protein